MATIYRKTPKGYAEIESRAHRLSPRVRSALIMIDGQRSDVELVRFLPQHTAEALQGLLEQGFIEVAHKTDPVGDTAPAVFSPPTVAPRAPAAPAAAPSGARPARSFESNKRDAVRVLTDQVGPIGEALAIRIEGARSPEALAPLLEVARQVIANTRGARAAADFAARFIPGP